MTAVDNVEPRLPEADDVMQPSEDEAEDREEDANELKNQGNALYRMGDYHQALYFYDRAVKKDPDNAKIYGNRAAALMMLQRYGAVITDCQKAIELDPEFAKAYGRLAKAYFQVGDLERALAKYHEATTLEINPDLKKEMDVVEMVRMCYNKSRACLANKEYEKGLTYAKLVLKEATDATPFKVLFCEALIHNGKPEEASQILAAVMRDNCSNNPDVLAVRAKALFFSGPLQLAQACNHLLRALQQDPDHEGARRLLKQIRSFESLKSEGNAFFAARKWSEAIDAYGRALLVEPENFNVNAVIFCNRAAAFKEEGQLKSAIQDCTYALNIDPSYVKAYQRRARCYQAEDEHEKAVKDFERVTQLGETPENMSELREAKILFKRSKRKDYYKLLGIPRTADERDIKKAYREQALRLHPDKLAGCTDEDKAKAEQQFKDVGEAYSVLSDPQKKQRYDAGVYDDGSGHTDAEDVDGRGFYPGAGPHMFFNPGAYGPSYRSGHGGGQTFSFFM